MERVYVVPRDELFARPREGFWPLSDQPEAEAIIDEQGFFMDREPAEKDPNYKQIIPYTVVVCGEKVLVYQRKSGAGEARLHGLRSIGVGGHINPIDQGPKGLIENNIERELHEELHVDADYHPPVQIGFVNEEQTEVGTVHMGLVVLVQVNRTEGIEIAETDSLEGEFRPIDEVVQECAANPKSFELWAGMVLGNIRLVLKRMKSFEYEIKGSYTEDEYGRCWARVRANSDEEALEKVKLGDHDSIDYKSDGGENREHDWSDPEIEVKGG